MATAVFGKVCAYLPPIFGFVVALFFEPRHILVLHAHTPDVCYRVRLHWAVPVPALVVVEVRCVQGLSLYFSLLHQHIYLRARKVHIAQITGKHGGIFGRSNTGITQMVPTVRPGLAIVTIIPLAVEIFADLTREAKLAGRIPLFCRVRSIQTCVYSTTEDLYLSPPLDI